MKIRNIDHFVLTVQDLTATLHFYVDLLGMEHVVNNGHHALIFGRQKINLHTAKGQFQPAADCPEYGSQDFCLEIEGSLEAARAEILAKGGTVLHPGIVARHGAMGPMRSFYLRDPDGNLVELSSYPCGS